LPPGEVIHRAYQGDPQIVFALSAAVERESRVVERWNNHYEMLRDLGELIAEVFS